MGFNELGLHRNGTLYDEDGYDKDGYDQQGFGRDGYNKQGYDQWGYDRRGYDRKGYDGAGYNEKGYGRDGYNKDGYNAYGYDRDGYKDGYDKWDYDREGYNRRGFNAEGKHRNGSYYDEDGYDKAGYDVEGYNKHGIDREGYNRRGFNAEGKHQNGSYYDADGYNIDGYDRYGFNRQNKMKDSRGEEEFDSKGVHKKRRLQKSKDALVKKIYELVDGKISIKQFVKHTSYYTMPQLLKFAANEGIDRDTCIMLDTYRDEFERYKVPFAKEEYLKTTTLIIGGQEIRPTKDDVDKCIEYLKSIKELVCNVTVRRTIIEYKNGRLDVSKRTRSKKEELISSIYEGQEALKGLQGRIQTEEDKEQRK